tara:strand:- start:1181 stop:1777 length:597 start_codon:yes stop_codon:yes gene_type:complete
MPRLRYRTKIDLGVAAVTILIGAFFTYQVSLVESIAEDAIGPRMIPYFLSIAMMLLGFIIGVSALVANKSLVAFADEQHSIAEEADAGFGFRDSDMTRVVAVVGMGFVYIWLFWAFGYVISTILSLALMLLVFGNRAPRLILILSIVGGLVYHYLFIHLMGLHDLAGAYFDLPRFLDDPSMEELTRKLPFIGTEGSNQ